ncbi:MAG: GNAT family N-acetyltransferase, partial [Candidatus Thermoplasmatota archaeon]|nr:GNAT family N-acetyltransferase [Candidatus Thermoplasmatota archaeon]
MWRRPNLIAGTACLWNMDLESDIAELGYELHPEYWRKGIMTEALEALIRWAFQEFELNRIEA